MAGGSVSFTLYDGETVIVTDETVRRIYELLWEASYEPGAVSTAALLMGEARLRPYARKPIKLTASQSAALTKAVARSCA